MTAIDAIKKIKVMLGLEKFEAVATLVDGTTKVHVDGEFAPGEQLHVVAEDGSFTPAPEGVHTTEDGKVITVDAAGVIVSVETATEEVEATEQVEEEKMEEIEVDAPVVGEAAVEVTEAVVEAVVNAIAPLVQEVTTMKEEMKKMKENFSKISNEPAAQPVKNNFSKEKTNVALEARLEAIAQLRTKK